ncbi:MAG: hypothetical protein Q9167_000755 [Letrouitia subvulpina]
MLDVSRLCNGRYLKRTLYRPKIADVGYIVIFCYLIPFSVFDILYPSDPRPGQPQTYEIENVVVQRIFCSFPLSDQYHKAPRYICYLLLVFTIVVRSHEWLAAGAAATVLTYTGVAAIHLVVLLAENNRFNLSIKKSRCEPIPISGAGAPFLACAGIDDPDAYLAMNIVSSVMLGALPLAAWSTTFRRSTSRPVLINWLLLLAVAHVSYTLVVTDPNHHFQICSKSNVEPPPGANYQAPILDQTWHNSLRSLVLTAQQSSQTLRNSSSAHCIYSCFATTSYVGRRAKDIGVYRIIEHGPFFQSESENRLNGILFWWAYTFLALLTLFTTEKTGWLPLWASKRIFSVDYCCRPSASKWKWKSVPNIAIIAGTQSVADASVATSTKIHVTILKLVQFLTQLLSFAVFCGCVVIVEIQNARRGEVLEQEPFTAVGQWGNLAVVLLVLLAAGVSRAWAGRGARSAIVEMRGLEEGVEEPDQVQALREGESSSSKKDGKNDWRGSEDRDAETERDDWDWRVGYAS